MISYKANDEQIQRTACGRTSGAEENRLSASRAIFIDLVRKASEEGDRSSLAEALGGLAEAENGIGNYQAARHHYANAAVLYRQIGPAKMLACTLRHEADLWMQTSRFAEAEPLYLEAEKVYREDGSVVVAVSFSAWFSGPL